MGSPQRARRGARGRFSSGGEGRRGRSSKGGWGAPQRAGRGAGEAGGLLRGRGGVPSSTASRACLSYPCPPFPSTGPRVPKMAAAQRPGFPVANNQGVTPQASVGVSCPPPPTPILRPPGKMTLPRESWATPPSDSRRRETGLKRDAGVKGEHRGHGTGEGRRQPRAQRALHATGSRRARGAALRGGEGRPRACTCGGHALRPLPNCPLTCLWVSVRQAAERVLGREEKPQELKAQPGQTHNTLYPQQGAARSISSGAQGFCQEQMSGTRPAHGQCFPPQKDL